MNHPLHEVQIDEPLVRALLRSQHPDLAGLSLVRVAQGWDNVTFRLGDDLAVRLPARATAAALLRHEQHWLPILAPLLPVPVPAPVRLGRPGTAFAWPWSVVPWLAGTPADELTPADRDAWAEQLAGTLAALHGHTPADTGTALPVPDNPVRGVPLRARA
ncbi:MAG TPA: phosphotransferase, partial [Cellulomonas sp.]